MGCLLFLFIILANKHARNVADLLKSRGDATNNGLHYEFPLPLTFRLWFRWTHEDQVDRVGQKLAASKLVYSGENVKTLSKSRARESCLHASTRSCNLRPVKVRALMFQWIDVASTASAEKKKKERNALTVRQFRRAISIDRFLRRSSSGREQPSRE